MGQRKKTGQPLVDEAIQSVEDRVVEIEKLVLLDGQLVGPVTLDMGASQLVKHGLQRAWRGWIIVNIQDATAAGFIVHDPPTPTVGYDRSKYIRLLADLYGGPITIGLYVF